MQDDRKRREIGKEVGRKKRRERKSEYDVGAMCEIKYREGERNKFGGGGEIEGMREMKDRRTREREREAKQTEYEKRRIEISENWK